VSDAIAKQNLSSSGRPFVGLCCLEAYVGQLAEEHTVGSRASE